MATGTAGSTARQLHTQQTHYLRKRVLFSDVAGGVVGVLPDEAIVLRGTTYIWEGFNDTTGDDIDIGVSGGDDDLFASAVDCNSAATTAFDDLANANQRISGDTTVTWNFTTAATGDGSTGIADIVIEYVVDNDG